MENLDFLGDEEPERIGVSQAEAGPEAETEHHQGYVPLQAVLDERTKRQALEQHAAELQAQLEQAQLEEVRHDEGGGYNDEGAADISTGDLGPLAVRQESLMLDTSERLAAMAHGPEITEAAKRWALEQPPEFRHMARTQSDPYDYLVRLYRHGQQDSQSQQSPGSGRPPAPPRSQAMTPSAGYGRSSYLSDEDAFDGAFSKRK